MEVVLSNKLEEIPRLAGLVDAFAKRYRLSSGVLHDVQVSLDEVLSNIIKYGFSDAGRHEITVRMTIEEDDLVTEVIDDGVPFNPLTWNAKSKGQVMRRPIDGFGIYFLGHLMDELAYERRGSSNHFAMRKSIQGNVKL